MPLPNRPAIDDLLEVMNRLRAREGGCPWDIEQTFDTIAPYTIEEAYEVADAIARKDMRDLKEELGDLLFQVVFHGHIAKEQGLFDFDDIARAMTDKLIRRHPHVFGAESERTSDEQTVAWEAIKAEERKSKAKHGILDDVPIGLPALTRAAKLTKRAARVGFDWPDLRDVLAKLDEETEELKVEIEAGNLENAKAELGDLLFVMANLARKLDVDPEEALRGTNAKFVRRFSVIESALAERGLTPDQSNLEDMDALWNEAKKAERDAASDLS
ncbi:nucleoside triphosphate pyrophosphohydrolase [Asticcacaulis endophyticus]|uniref:Nucleoside triphosphate pyrophosphohydrolase n=1 Tax=Asticcacaulis endophyticus TaxID=1395890 RepID=A0A918Q920_9CAUL|nr:nucleoside triphosphate pyrophosphohydrolase [Asticcacaulis endophyticus]GGZ37854.1 nucleoside triphosphate pyrophosphohydrolase [Asticcacaulis endophyticus]